MMRSRCHEVALPESYSNLAGVLYRGKLKVISSACVVLIWSNN